VSALLRTGEHFGLSEPTVYGPGATDISAALRRGVEAFTPEWRPAAVDPGDVLVQLFGEMADLAAGSVRGLPERARVELLRVAGIDALPATPAQAMVVFDVSPTAPESVLVPAGFQLGARPATEGDLVVFETDRPLRAAPGKISEVGSVRGSAFRNLTAQNADPSLSFSPFGIRPRLGDALLLGIDGDSPPTGAIAVGIGVTRPPGAAAPISEGGLYPVPVAPPVQLSWDALDGARWITLELVRDETWQLSRTGVVELGLPDLFRPGRPPQSPQGPARRWLRVRIVAGQCAAPPELDFVRINAVPVSAGRTLYDEVLEPVPGSRGRKFRLSKGPLLEESLILDVDDGSGFRKWERVQDLSSQGPGRAVFTLDAAAAEVTFGDGVHGHAVPEGLRQVRARSYRRGATGEAVVKAEAIKSLLGSVASVTGVVNPRPAGGGDPQEDLRATVRRGPDLIRAHWRSVLPSDYELLALRCPGARVRRVHAMPGRHPSMPSTLIPGVVGLLIVPPLEEGVTVGPPLPDALTLGSVARHVSAKLAPAGVEIVAGAPVYHAVRIEAQVRLRQGIDQGTAVALLLAELDAYLSPLTGGAETAGWPFGGTLAYEALLRRLLGLENVLAVPRLSMIVDGRRVPPCQDREIGEHDLLWPSAHLVIPVQEDVR
jgi:predicted phage baseplate assembly protein